MEPQVLLIACPWRHPGEPALGLAILRGILEQSGILARCLYAALLYPRTPLASNFLDRHGATLFAPFMRGGPSRTTARNAILSRYADDMSLHGIRCTRAEAAKLLPQWLPQAIDQEIERAGQWLQRAADRLLAMLPDAQEGAQILGFSITFESQIPATIALLQRVTEKRPTFKVILGGAACQAEQAEGLLASFSPIDAVCYSEGEAVIAPLVRALGRGADEQALHAVPGIVFRDARGQIVQTPAPPLLRNLDTLPLPRYDDFLGQLDASEWRDAPVRLPFETSRGCWWGQKHLCTFCGLNGEGLAFRAKSAARAYEEIVSLYSDYPRAHYLIAADNIIAMSYFKELLPRLAALPREADRPLRIFYEIKSNLDPDQIALLQAAGIHTVQPGIESFSDEVLRLMDKGATGLGQIQFLKWAVQCEVASTYNLLLRNPGESAPSYREVLELLPALHQLPPPDGVVLTEIERFSMYHRSPARYGLSNLRPQPHYRGIYPNPEVDVTSIAYQYDYDHPIKEDAELKQVHRALCDAVDAWRAVHKPDLAYYLDRGEVLLLVDHRPQARQRQQLLAGTPALLYRYLDRQRPWPAVQRRFAELDATLLRDLLERWRADRLICATGQGEERRFLAVLPRKGPAAAAFAAPRSRAPLRLEVLRS